MPLLDAAAARCHYDRRRRSTVARPLDRAAHRRVRASRQIALSMRLLAVHPRLPVRVPCALLSFRMRCCLSPAGLPAAPPALPGRRNLSRL